MNSVCSDLVSIGKPCQTSFYDGTPQVLEVVESGRDANCYGLRTAVHALQRLRRNKELHVMALARHDPPAHGSKRNCPMSWSCPAFCSNRIAAAAGAMKSVMRGCALLSSWPEPPKLPSATTGREWRWKVDWLFAEVNGHLE